MGSITSQTKTDLVSRNRNVFGDRYWVGWKRFPDPRVTHLNRASTSADTSYKTIRTREGYRMNTGIHHIVWRSPDRFRGVDLGLVPEGFNVKTSDTCDQQGGIRLASDTGTITNDNHGEPIFIELPNGGYHTDEGKRVVKVKCVTFIIDTTESELVEPTVQILYDDTPQGKWSFNQLGLDRDTVIYPAMSAHTCSQVIIDAPLDNTKPQISLPSDWAKIPSTSATKVIAGVVCPADFVLDSARAPTWNQWFTGGHPHYHPGWFFDDADHGVSNVATRLTCDGTYGVIRTFAGYRHGHYTVDFKPAVNDDFGAVLFGLVPSSFNAWNAAIPVGTEMTTTSAALVLNTYTGELHSRGTAPKKLGYVCNGHVKYVRFVLDLPSSSSSSPIAPPTVTIWYDNEKKGCWTLAELGLAPSSTYYPVYCSNTMHVGVKLEAFIQLHDPTEDKKIIKHLDRRVISLTGAVPSTAPVTGTNRTLGHGWSRDINDYIFSDRYGTRSTPHATSYYGVNAAVYRARLTPEARARALTAGASVLCHGEFVVKICYSYDLNTTTDAILGVYESELEVYQRLPPHDNIVRIHHYFAATIPTNRLKNWDASSSVVAPRALFLVTDTFYLSLQNIIGHRTRAHRPLPLFRPEEVLMVARDISSALILLGKELIAHRDIKPDNILIRFPSHVSQSDVLENLNQPGVTIALTDFGAMCDFKANKCKDMKMFFPRGMLLGGAPSTWPPEIASAKLPCELDYTKADVWSLGIVLATMMSVRADRPVVDATTKQLNADVLPAEGQAPTLWPTDDVHMLSTLANACTDTITSMVHTEVSTRWACEGVYNAVLDIFATLVPPCRPTPPTSQ